MGEETRQGLTHLKNLPVIFLEDLNYIIAAGTGRNKETTHPQLKVKIPIKRNYFENHVISRENPPKHQGNHQETISCWERYKTYEETAKKIRTVRENK